MGKAEKSELSEISEQGLKLFQLRLFGFHPYAKNEKSEGDVGAGIVSLRVRTFRL